MTLNYIGSKKKLLPFINYVISSNVEEKGIFGDLFAGTGIVGDFFSKKGYSIISNDIENYSYVVNYATLISSYNKNIENLINILNNEEAEGLIYNEYSPKGNRLFFTIQNSKKADGIRIKIEELKKEKKINKDEYYFLLASLIQSLDKVANTTSVYGAFLKKFKTSASIPLILKPIHKNINNNNNIVIKKNILDFNQKCDIIYIDPPYVSRQYGANYCPLNFLVEYNDEIKIRGKSGLFDYYKSPFASKSKAKNAFIDMFKILSKYSRHIFLSYNNQGILKEDDITNIMIQYGNVKLYVHNYKKYQAVKSKGGGTEEFIFYVKVDYIYNKYTTFQKIYITEKLLL